MDNRGVSPVVEKLLSLGLVVLFVALLTTTLFGGAVPKYQTAVGAELGERTLAQATARIEQAVAADATAVAATYRVDLPATIAGAAYEIRAENGELLLVHPDDGIGARSRPVLPPTVTTVTGSWESGAETVVRVDSTTAGLRVSLEDA